MIFAWANLAMHFAILGINTHIRTSGIISSEQVEGNTVNTYLKPDAIETLQTQYLNLANSIVRKYLIESDIENPGSYIPAT